MESSALDTLGPLAYTMFHISQSTEGCKEEDKILTGRDTEDVIEDLGEYLASFVLYSGTSMS